MKTIGILVVVIVVIAGVWYALSAQKASAPVTETPVTTDSGLVEPTSPSAGPANDDSVTDVTLTDAGFSPASVTISIGDTVRFTNNSSGRMWVGADNHPTHTTYDGTSVREHCQNGTSAAFDECGAVETGGTFDFTFTKAGTFGYHNHVRASETGTVVVK